MLLVGVIGNVQYYLLKFFHTGARERDGSQRTQKQLAWFILGDTYSFDFSIFPAALVMSHITV